MESSDVCAASLSLLLSFSWWDRVCGTECGGVWVVLIDRTRAHVCSQAPCQLSRRYRPTPGDWPTPGDPGSSGVPWTGSEGEKELTGRYRPVRGRYRPVRGVVACFYARWCELSRIAVRRAPVRAGTDGTPSAEPTIRHLPLIYKQLI